MSLWSSRSSRPEQRATLDQVLGALVNGVTGSHAKIDGSQIGNAQQSVAVRSAVDLIASLCSELPVKFFKVGGRQVERPMPAYLEDPSGDGYGLQDWTYQLLYSWLYRGNTFAEELDRDPKGWITQARLFHPDKVHGDLEDGRVRWTVDGGEIPRMRHWRVNPVPGQILGLSPIAANADTIGISLAATRFGKGWFDADAQPIGILRNSLGPVDQDKARTVKDRFMAALAGSRDPVVMGRGWEWQSLSVSPEESQFLGTMGYTEAQCARIFGPGIAEILGYETGAPMTYSNVQDRDIQLLKYSVNRWLRRKDRVLNLFLPPNWKAETARDAMLETNTMQRYQAYASALGNQPWKEVNEVRELENLPPLAEPAPDPATEDTPTEGEPA